MSLKAKLEAVIYAVEEPVTLTQLAQLFAAEALEWKATQEAAAAEQAAEVAGDVPAPSQQMLAEGLEYLGLEDTPAVYTATATDPSQEADRIKPELAKPWATEDTEDGAETVVPKTDSLGQPPAHPLNEPLDTEAEAKRLARQRERDVRAILRQLLDELIAECATDDRGLEIREIAGGYRMATKPEFHDVVRMFVKSLKTPMKLSLPALETLAVIAYKQPVTAPEVNDIRGVESGGVLGSLLARKLIATAGRKSVIGRPILYKTTKEFLLRFGLKDLAELPSMEEFEKMAAEIEEMEPEVVASDAYDAASEEAADAEGREDIPLNWEELPEPDELDENAPLPTNHSGKRETTLEAPTAASALSNEPRPAESGLAEPEPAESEPAEPGPAHAEREYPPTENEINPHGQENHEER